ncbi:hypothetical protein GLYMA_08G107400v4 [Glycine max]|uniref:Uncharacterized protein n=1 Tax=Glycine max TaxID=3847 RepID=K7L5Z4_SOYBN|nr:hypothetical protein GYH30_020870 [Glycine max]KRH42725.1 hypothetical protein GLYMA_08G107400v4 [Glycine max]
MAPNFADLALARSEAMDTVPSSRQRSHSSGTLTRARSQLYHHRNRSGQLRFDPVPSLDEPCAELLGFRRTNCKKAKRDDGDLPRRLTKDLRARRVYSPPQSTNSGLIESAFPKGNAEAIGSPDLGLFFEARGFDRGNADLFEESGGDCSEKFDGLDGATTLPDAEICGGSNSKVNKDVEKLDAEVPVKDTPSTGNGSSLKSKSVLRPCFQGKLFKAPGSVNYRRLFPFQKDTVRDDSDTPKLGFCQKDQEGRQGFQLPLSPQSEEESKQELKTDATADYGVKDATSDLPDDGLKQLSSHMNNLDCVEASTSQEFGVLNEECIQTTPPDADIYVNSEVNVKPMDFTRSTHENAGQGFCLKADKVKDSLKSKSVPRQLLHRKLFKTPGSVSYKRLLPFLMDLTKDDSDRSKFDHQTHHQEDEAKRFQLPLSSESEEASIDEHKTNSSPMHGTVESNGLENYVLVNPSHGNQPKLTPSQDFPEFPMQLDAKEVVRGDLSAPSVNEHTENFAIASKDECLSASELNPCSVMVDGFHSAKNVAHNDGVKEVQNTISRQHDSDSPPKDQYMLYLKGDVSGLTSVHRSSKEKGFTIAYDESKQFVNLKERESVSRFPPECQTLSQLDLNVLDAEENVTSLNHVQVSNDILGAPSENITSEKSDMAGHSGDKAGSVQNGIVLCSRMPSKGSDNKNASGIKNGSESKITSVLKRCPQFKLLKHAGSLNYKRLLPFILDTMKDDSCASVNDHHPKLAKSMDQTPLPISTSNLHLTPVNDSNGCVPVEHFAGNSCPQQQSGLQACDLNNDSSSPKSQIPEFQSSHDSCKVIQLQDEQVVLNGLCKPESSTDPSISVHGIDLPITTLAPMINEVTTREATPDSSKSLSVFSEVKGNNSFLMSSNEKLPETHECSQSLSQLQVVEQLRVPAVGLKKGILKRNPRGCRGVCACLNCASFRLHAERAFEFSKNQLLDAEEVAHNLMKELSHLRNMLESSADSVNNNPVFGGSQVKEACRKACAAEELAKNRLSQMHDDLNIHCRITSLQPPTVTFAVHVEKEVIQPGG